jgi:hypothetical protein
MNVEEFHNRLRELYLPPEGKFTIIDVPEIRYAMIDGEGRPESAAMTAASKWLYALVHIVKPYVKERMGKNFAEPPLEYLFWAENEKDFIEGNQDAWRWRVMVVFTDWIDQDRFDQAVSAVEIKLGQAPASLRLEDLQEGKSVQTMHVGEYEKIQAVCHELYTNFLPENGLKPNGFYHEIYLNDPDRTAPHKRKVVIRQPVA